MTVNSFPPADSDGWEPAGVDVKVAHPARVWDYWLGGKDNFAADREFGDGARDLMPAVVASARADRMFLGRAVRYLVGEVGIRQLLDVGTGLPSADNTHEVAQRVAPECRIVYIDNDPIVMTHARALLTSTPEGATTYLEIDAREPGKIAQAAAQTLDFTQPIALMLLGVLNFLTDAEAHTLVDTLVDAVPAGSHLAIAHPTREAHGEAMDEIVRHWNAVGADKLTLRSPAQIAGFLNGLDMLEPGVVSCPRWRPDPDAPTPDVFQFCAVGRKP